MVIRICEWVSEIVLQTEVLLGFKLPHSRQKCERFSHFTLVIVTEMSYPVLNMFVR